MFEGWDDFYLLIGSAAAALIGLLFVVATLSTGNDRRTAEKGQRLYMTPIVFHLAVIVVLSAMAMAPTLQPVGFGLITGIAVAAGLGQAMRSINGIRNAELGEPPHWTDVWFYGVGPGVVYLALAAASVVVLLDRHDAENWIATITVVLLLLSIRNAWDLVTFLAPRSEDKL